MRRSLAEPVRLDRRARPLCPDAGVSLRVAARSAGCRRLVIVEVVGEVDHYSAPLLDDCLRRQCDRRGLRELVVDLDRVTFLAGAGLTILAQARQRCSARGVRLAVRCSDRRAVLRPLGLAGLSDLVHSDHAECRSPSVGNGLATVVHLPSGTRIGSGPPGHSRALPGALGPALAVCEVAHQVGKPRNGAGGRQSQRILGQPWRAE